MGPKAMTLSSVLVPLSGGPNGEGALVTAVTLARLFGPRIDALHVRVKGAQAIPGMAEGVTGVLVERLMDSIEARGAEQVKSADALFRKVCRNAATGALPAGFAALAGRPEIEIAHRGRLSDLVVFEACEDEPGPEYPAVLEAALFETGRPVLLSTPGGVTSFEGKAVLAWNDSVEAARAMGAALPLLAVARSVTVVTVRDRCDASPEDAVSFLRGHGIEARPKVLEPDYRAVGEQIQDEAIAEAGGLLVMGAYSHSRLRELVLGGVTDSITKAPRVPVLMAH